MRRTREQSNMADTVERMHAVAAEIEALYSLRFAAEEAVRLGDFAPLHAALEQLTLAERVRRGSP